MVNIQVRDVPVDLRNALAAAARTRGQSMQAYLMTLFEEARRRERNLDLLKQLDSLGGGYSGPGANAVDEIAEQREARQRRIEGDE